MTCVELLTLRRLVVLAALCSCGTSQVRVEEPKGFLAEPKVLAEDLRCDRDADCEIVDHDVYGECCVAGEESEPYAISRAAVERHGARQRVECGGVQCPPTDYESVGRRTSYWDWQAVCCGHVCKRRAVEWGSSKKGNCGH